MTILLGIGIGLFILVMRIGKYTNSKKALEEAKVNHTFQIFDGSRPWIIFYVIAIIVSVATGIYSGIIDYSEINLTLSIVLCMSFISEIFSTKIYRKVYYDNKSFFYVDRLVRYGMIKNFKKRTTPFTMEVVLTNGETFPVPSKALYVLQDLMIKQKEEKKKRKL